VKNKIEYFKKIALETENNSTCGRLHVGAVLVKDERIISIGWNGTLPGKIHCENLFAKKKLTLATHHEWSLKNELHAEMNLLMFCAKNGIKTKGCEVFITVSPCMLCTKLIIAAGIKKVYFILQYNDFDEVFKSFRKDLKFIQI